MIAHDLRTPVAAIKGFSQLVLRQSDVPPKVGRYVASVVDEANHLAALIDDLLLLNRLEQGVVRSQSRTVKLDELLEVVLVRTTHWATALRLATPSSAATPVARCDPVLTERAIANLLHASLKYCHRGEGGLIGSRASPDGPLVWVAAPALVGDTYSEERVDAEDTHIATSAEDLNPTNLSLYLCAQLTEIQGGQLLGDVSPGGARFWLVLPPSNGHEQ
jgi:signal transduction histidine kinase